MTPTNELRFVEREVNQQISKVPDQWEKRTLRILQQKWQRWIHHPNGFPTQSDEEWRDVPVCKEEAND